MVKTVPVLNRLESSDYRKLASAYFRMFQIVMSAFKCHELSAAHFGRIRIEMRFTEYIGCTEDLKSRLEKHNQGDVPHTAKFRPWRIKNAIAFDDREKAYAFEAYLKTHCGRAFAKRHFLIDSSIYAPTLYSQG